MTLRKFTTRTGALHLPMRQVAIQFTCTHASYVNYLHANLDQFMKGISKKIRKEALPM